MGRRHGRRQRHRPGPGAALLTRPTRAHLRAAATPARGHEERRRQPLPRAHRRGRHREGRGPREVGGEPPRGRGAVPAHTERGDRRPSGLSTRVARAPRVRPPRQRRGPHGPGPAVPARAATCRIRAAATARCWAHPPPRDVGGAPPAEGHPDVRRDEDGVPPAVPADQRRGAWRRRRVRLALARAGEDEGGDGPRGKGSGAVAPSRAVL
mmetsp:Transcript_5369/g.10680  ORF Transcript_5369/g.10680 Transcript_5369/m.10680 type:complete len:210 (-) Transcript_5369:324-953(-)